MEEMFIALQALGVEFVDVFRPGRTRGKPTACRDDFQSADRRIISRRTCEFCRDRFACEFCGCDGFGREFLKQVLLLGRGGSVDAGIEWRSQFDGHFLVVLARVFSCTSRDFRCKQAEDDAVLVGAPHRAIVPQEAGARAFLAAEAGSSPKAMSNRSFRLTRLAMGFGEQRNRKPA